MQGLGFRRDWFHVYRLWILERTPSDAAPPAAVPPEGVRVQLLDRHARRDWACQQASDRLWPQFRVALENEHELFLAYRGDAVVGWGWLGFARVDLAPLGRSMHLAPGTAYLYDAFVEPPERGRGLGRALVAARVQHAAARGVERLVTHVLTGNEPSRRALEACGFRIVGRTAFVRALALRVWTRPPLPARRGPVRAPHAA